MASPLLALREGHAACSCWIGAPALANVVGPVLAGTLIDLGGFSPAFAALLLIPLSALWSAARVPAEASSLRLAGAAARNSWDLLLAPDLRRLLLVSGPRRGLALLDHGRRGGSRHLRGSIVGRDHAAAPH